MVPACRLLTVCCGVLISVQVRAEVLRHISLSDIQNNNFRTRKQMEALMRTREKQRARRIAMLQKQRRRQRKDFLKAIAVRLVVRAYVIPELTQGLACSVPLSSVPSVPPGTAQEGQECSQHHPKDVRGCDQGVRMHCLAQRLLSLAWRVLAG